MHARTQESDVHVILRQNAANRLSTASLQSTYSTTAINFDFALITLISDVAPALGYFGIERGSGDVKFDINSAGYPADKSSGSMWLTTCSGVEYDFGENQGVFKDVSQCANNVSTVSPTSP